MSAKPIKTTRSFNYVLVPRIIEMSAGDLWEEAKREWDYTAYDRSLFENGDGQTCLCEYYPITHLHTITNRLNGNKAIIGSCCIQQFLGLADIELKSIARIRADASMPLNVSAIELAHSQGWINDWERSFCLNTQRKRKLSYKQQEKRIQINELVLARLAPVIGTEEREEARAEQ